MWRRARCSCWRTTFHPSGIRARSGRRNSSATCRGSGSSRSSSRVPAIPSRAGFRSTGRSPPSCPSGLEVHRVSGPEPAASAGWRGRGERWLRLSRPWQRWWIEGSADAAIAAGRDAQLALREHVAVRVGVLGAAAPLAPLGVPWVADLRDPWALDEMLVYPSRAHRALEVRRMRAGLGSAAAIVMNTPEAAAQLTRRLPRVPRSARRRDHERLRRGGLLGPASDARGRRVPDRAHRLVAHGAGSRRSTRRARALLGGSIGGVDFLPRSHVFLLEAVDRALAERPELAGRLEVHLAGALSDHDRAFTRDYVRVHGYLDHSASVALVRSADLLFLPMHDVGPASGRDRAGQDVRVPRGPCARARGRPGRRRPRPAAGLRHRDGLCADGRDVSRAFDSRRGRAQGARQRAARAPTRA